MQSRALLVRGHQGVGKTTLSEHLATNYGFCKLSKDDQYVPIMERYDNHRLASDIAYMGIRSVLKANPRSGINFVVDAPFNGALGAPELLYSLDRWGFMAKSVLLVCSNEESWEQRLRLRGSAPNHLVTSLDEIRSFRGTLESTPLDGELVLDTANNDVASLAGRCVEYLQDDAAPPAH